MTNFDPDLKILTAMSIRLSLVR